MIFKYIKLLVIIFVFKIAECQVGTTAGAIELSQNYEVVFVFRHGDRTPDKFYPNDPNKIDNFYPDGPGELTPIGKARAYELGTQLRHLYKVILGETYVPHALKARSTDVNRTKMSLKFVLSALYPSGREQIFDLMLNRQSIPFSYAAMKDDFLLPLFSCPLYNEELIRVENSDEIINQVEKYRPLMANLTQWTGKVINSSIEMLFLYHTLMSESSMGLQLPNWTENIFPNGPLLNATILRLKILNYNTKLRRLFSGFLLKNIIESMNGIANGTIKDGRKIHLFSAHDINVASLLITLGVFEPHVPEYASAVIVELLRDKHEQYFVGIRYYLGIPPITKVLYIASCGTSPCPLKEFIHLMENIIPTDDDTLCFHIKNTMFNAV